MVCLGPAGHLDVTRSLAVAVVVVVVVVVVWLGDVVVCLPVSLPVSVVVRSVPVCWLLVVPLPGAARTC